MNKPLNYLFFLAISLAYTYLCSSQTLDIEKANIFYEKGKSFGLCDSICNNCDSSISYYSQAILYNSTNSEYYYQRARCYFVKNEYDKAILDFSESINIKESAKKLYDRAQVYLQMFDENKNNINNAQNALDDFLKVKSKYPNFKQIEVDAFISELNTNLPNHTAYEHSVYEDLGNDLYLFHLSKEKFLYIKLPLIIKSATYNIIKQDPNATGEGSGEFLLLRGNKQQFLDTFISCVNIIQNEGKLFIMTIDAERVGMQEDLTYGTDPSNLKWPEEHYTWFGKYGGSPATGWLKFDEKNSDEPENLITHNGTLRIRVLKESKPVKILRSVISCAKNEISEDFDGVYEITVAISNCEVTNLNLKLALPDKTRWLVDKSFEPLLMTDYHLEINGKNFPNKMEYVDTNTNKGESADFMVRLKKRL